MNKKIWQVITPIIVLAGCTGLTWTISAVADKTIEEPRLDNTPVVTVDSAVAYDHQVIISAFGTLQPMEETPLAAQVQGEVVSVHPNFVDGGMISRGEVLFSVEGDAYEAALMRAEADLATAEANLIQEQAQADVAADEARRNPNKKYTELFLRKPQVLSAEAQVKSAQAGLKIAQRDLSNTDIVAPFDALVVSKSVGLGQYLNPGEATATLFSVEQALVRVPIPGFEAAFLPDSVAGISVEITPGRSGDVTRIGRIRHDLGIVDEATRMSHLLVQLDDPYGLQSGAPAMKFGSYLQVRFPGKQLNHVFKVPQELVTNRTLWLVDDDSKLRARKVDVVREESGFVIIGAGIADRDRVVTSPPEYPRDGMTVRVKAPSNEQTAGQEVSAILSSL